MTASIGRFVASPVVLLGSMLIAGPAEAVGGCHKITARGVGQDLGGGVTEARVIGGGLLHGTTLGNFTITGVSGSVATFVGTVEFATSKATLTVAVTGTLNLSSGAFSASGPVSAATGRLAGATGNLTFNGVEN